MNTKKLWIFLILMGCLHAVHAQSSACSNSACQDDSLLIRTGYDHSANSTYGAGKRDAFWKLVNAPSYATVTIPSPVWVINTYGGWDSISPNSMWVSPYSSASFHTNNPIPQPPYAIETEFCTCDSDSVTLHLKVMVDDVVDVLLNGDTLGSFTAGYQFQTANMIIIDTSLYLPSGTHKLRFDVRNTGQHAMGLLVEGYMLGAHNIKSKCCNPNSSICGVKYHDLNTNGQRDSTFLEPTLSNWEIVLKDSLGNAIDTTTTDMFGEYCFTNIPPGNYTVCELNQPMWVQYEPDSFYTISLDTQEVVTVNFGNGRCVIDPKDSISLNTGYNHETDSLYTQHYEDDNYWKVISDPGGNPPYPASVRQYPASAWAAALPNTKWITAVTPNRNGYFTYERCFCLDAGFSNATLNLDLRADDSAIVYLNGNLLGNTTTTPPFAAYNTPTPYNFNTSNQSYFQMGQNCITIRVWNLAQSVSGINVSGSVTTDSLSAVQRCCDSSAQAFEPNSSICGTKFHDLNCNGVFDLSDTGMVNWVIYLKDTSGTILDSATTDAQGAYCFSSLYAGQYEVCEVMQTGWLQSFPGGTSQSHTISLDTGETFTANFGNCEDSCFTQDQLTIGSGFDHTTMTTYPLGAMDPNWVVISDPYGTVGGIVTTISNSPPWTVPVGASQWVNSQPGTSHLPGLYSYQYCFCVKAGTVNPGGSFEFRCDDSAVVYLNGNPLVFVPPGTAFGGPSVLVNMPSALFQSGINCIQVDVFNTAMGATGFTLFGGVGASANRRFEYSCCSGLFQVPIGGVVAPEGPQPELMQNAPNPFRANTYIEYFLPEASQQAVLKVFNLQGQEIATYDLARKGKGVVEIKAGTLPEGIYLYTLLVDGQLIKTRKMILTK